MPIANRKKAITFFSDPLCPTYHSIQIIAAEKDIPVSIEYADIHYATLAPLLWGLPISGIDFSLKTKIVGEYAHRIFSRQSFQKSLSDFERDMRAGFAI
ncbi:hypothetical protein [Candidatus Nitrosacidococcus tergens]|uniref:Uncharacterized protein n=1 Tax=Candidatus Nitrosacidococcus tergens TaxID=553981 RepID=A0A7G1Q770_9GAMM|nr:hypothetical protein [Candidatus Nitrosacidococcus tergens]CAB1274277.1 protein of unknown function [Candidatus Nitrosacidococcus tergens]